jgi:cell division initiation protein
VKISPLDIYNKDFKKSTFGYNVNQVDEFREEIGLAFERLLKEVNNLQDENEKMKERLSIYTDIEKQLEKMLTTIQEAGKEQTDRARKEAEIIIQKAEMKAEQIVQETREKLKGELKSIQNLKDSKDLFRIKLRSLLQSHLQMLEDEEVDLDLDIAREDIAAGHFELDE